MAGRTIKGAGEGPDIGRRAILAGFASLGALAATGANAQLPEHDVGPKLDVPYVPTPQAVVDRMLEIAKVSGQDFVMDLGCGDGRMLVAAALKTGARGFGVDLNPKRIEEANSNARNSKVADKVRFEVKNLFDTPIRDADVLTMYLLPSVNLQLRPRILDEMKPGSRIVSHAFDMGDWEPDLREEVGYSRIFYWIVPAKIGGKWIITDGSERIEANLNQSFQKIVGGAVRASGASGSAMGLVTGNEAHLLVQIGGEARLYAGRVYGDTITPLPRSAAPKGWTATRG